MDDVICQLQTCHIFTDTIENEIRKQYIPNLIANIENTIDIWDACNQFVTGNILHLNQQKTNLMLCFFFVAFKHTIFHSSFVFFFFFVSIIC